MMTRLHAFVLAVGVAAVSVSPLVHAQDRCTAILVGAKASTTNAPMTTHTNDCSSCDYRIIKVPQQTHAPDAVHEVTLVSFDYPRYVGNARGPEYTHEKLDKRFYNWTDTPVIGTIPEVNTTYAYIDGAYGIINEHQVAIGESTCGARFYSKPATQGGDALFDVTELSRIALQRSTTAREAIQIMGDLGVKYGYYGAEWEGDGVYGEAGEALTVTDTTEAWMFHILPDDTGKSAIWAAQRVPDDHISAVANQFVIHELELNNTDFFMASPNIHEVAIRNNLWSPDSGEAFDFTRIFSQPRDEGHQYYSTRRVWRVFTLADPGLDLSPYTDVYSSGYPFSVKTAQKLSPHDIMRFQRDHYEGTPFDMTKGAPGGPYGNPDRYDPGMNGDLTEKDIASGHFERAISIFRTSYSFVSVLDPSNPDNAFLWFGQYSPHSTVYVPVFTKVDKTPSFYSKSSLLAYDRDSSFWTFALVGNWVSRFYKYAHPFVEKVQLDIEDSAEKLQGVVLQEAAQVKASQGEAAMREFLTDQSTLFASQSQKAFSVLFEYLVTAFHDGYQFSNFSSPTLHVTPLFYPKWWLELVGFFNASLQPSVPLSSADAGETPLPTTPAKLKSVASGGGDEKQQAGVSYVAAALIAAVSAVVGGFIGAKVAVKRQKGYQPIQ
ncbi:hypothetical protein Poli38472_003598 [Pythium oligandrum]|uniref:Dipeptidase n=1 Tax=Pythium oligandrum TaxID=41045 RepID=A0A8K1FPP6_PYTOL|nr:hypothetical protein Poli38472_003598 [Pythium oligandrum]|eukprot:TMW65833.1 hypothetical protein Poli38472_003598 [Pythium oligandrum]